MNDSVVKVCVDCNTAKSIDNFSDKYKECKTCNIKRVLKRYHNNKDDILQKRRDKYARSKDLDKRLKALEEIFSEDNWCFFCKWNHLKNTSQTKNWCLS